jgi:hypothetical protein
VCKATLARSVTRWADDRQWRDDSVDERAESCKSLRGAALEDSERLSDRDVIAARHTTRRADWVEATRYALGDDAGVGMGREGGEPRGGAARFVHFV